MMPRTRSTHLRRSMLALVTGAAMTGLVGFAATSGTSGAVATELSTDGSFESGTANWYASPASIRLSRLSGGVAGSSYVRLTHGGSAANTVVLNDHTNTVLSTTKARTYNASVWVRTTTPATTVNLRLMEWNGSVAGQANKSVYLTGTGWQRVSLAYTALTTGSQIDVNVLAWNVAPGDSFDVDGISVSSSAAETPATVQTLAPSSPVTAPATTPTTTPVTQAGRQLVWSDEFNEIAVDGTKWRVRNNTYASNEQSCVTSRSKNVSEESGVLRIAAARETYACTSSVTKQFTSGYLDTIGKASWTYGSFEMRAKLPTQAGTSKGLWPAFWLRPSDGGTGEIDVMEAIGSGAGETESTKVHETIWYDYKGTQPAEPRSTVMPGDARPSDGFHVYRLDWTSSSLTWFIDGVKVYERSPSTTPWFSSKFNKPYNIRLNMQVGGSWAGSPNTATDFSRAYEIDYVRVYQ